MTRSAPIIAGIVAVFLLLFAAYLSAYYAMLEPGAYSPRAGGLYPVYRTNLGHEVLEVVFMPAHGLDRLIRPGYWANN